jgi:ankyrin repeat protein
MTWRGLYLAISNKHGDVAKRLLQHPEAPLQAAFLWAAEEGFDSLLEFILKTKGDEINPLYSKSLCLRQAATNGHHAVVALLLDDNRALPQVLGNQAMRTAAENGHIEVVKLLLSDERVNPGARENKALRMAASKGHDKIVDLLLKCPKIDLNKRGYEAAENAIYTNFWPVLELFIKDARLNLDGLVSKARSQDNYNIIFLLFRHLPWSFDTLLLKLNKGSPIYQNDERRFIASKLLNTCGLFQLAEPALPQDVNKVIAQYMIKVSNEGESQSLTQTHPKSG